MQIFELPNTSHIGTGGIKKIILALGAESAGNFSVFFNPPTPLLKGGNKLPPFKRGVGGLYLSEDFGDLLDDKNFVKFKKSVLNFLKKNKIKPDVILTDLHPEYRTTLWGEELSKKFSARGGSASGGKAEHTQVQHHHAHIFSAIGEQYLQAASYKLQANTIGIALDGTGYGLDGKIWGGEVFECQMSNVKCRINRIGQLENQTMIGGDLAVREPARMLLAILAGIKNYELGIKNNKEFVYWYVKKHYTRNQFELLYNQLQQNFNCVETSSAGRILDAVSLLLGFCGNERNYKHEPIVLLEQNSTLPYNNLKPKIISLRNEELRLSRTQLRGITNYELSTTYLFEYLLKNLCKNKKRLAATAQLYIAQGLYEIAASREPQAASYYLGGGIANNKIISGYLESKRCIANKKIPRGDAGLSFGQIMRYLHNNTSVPPP